MAGAALAPFRMPHPRPVYERSPSPWIPSRIRLYSPENFDTFLEPIRYPGPKAATGRVDAEDSEDGDGERVRRASRYAAGEACQSSFRIGDEVRYLGLHGTGGGGRAGADLAGRVGIPGHERTGLSPIAPRGGSPGPPGHRRLRHLPGLRRADRRKETARATVGALLRHLPGPCRIGIGCPPGTGRDEMKRAGLPEPGNPAQQNFGRARL